MSEWLTLFFFFLEGKEPNSAASREREESVAAAKVAGRGCDASHSQAFKAPLLRRRKENEDGGRNAG